MLAQIDRDTEIWPKDVPLPLGGLVAQRSSRQRLTRTVGSINLPITETIRYYSNESES